jgi:hypothetical protein
MKSVTLSVPDNEYPFLMELIKKLDFVKVKETDTVKTKRKKKILDDLKEAIEEVNLAKQGKVKLKSARQLLNEL